MCSTVTELDFIQIEHKFKKEYKALFNIDPDDVTTRRIYTNDEQIESYAQNIVLWSLRKPELSIAIYDDSFHRDQAILSYVSDRLRNMFQRIDDVFFYDEESKTILFKRVVELMIMHGDEKLD